MSVGTSTNGGDRPPLLPLPPRKSRPVPPLKKPARPSLIAAAKKARRPR
jgi:hypothetical protein